MDSHGLGMEARVCCEVCATVHDHQSSVISEYEDRICYFCSQSCFERYREEHLVRVERPPE